MSHIMKISDAGKYHEPVKISKRAKEKNHGKEQSKEP